LRVFLQKGFSPMGFFYVSRWFLWITWLVIIRPMKIGSHLAGTSKKRTITFSPAKFRNSAATTWKFYETSGYRWKLELERTELTDAAFAFIFF
jgi:hypothetical protein